MSVKNWLTTQMEILLGFSDPTLVGHILRYEHQILNWRSRQNLITVCINF